MIVKTDWRQAFECCTYEDVPSANTATVEGLVYAVRIKEVTHIPLCGAESKLRKQITIKQQKGSQLT